VPKADTNGSSQAKGFHPVDSAYLFENDHKESDKPGPHPQLEK